MFCCITASMHRERIAGDFLRAVIASFGRILRTWRPFGRQFFCFKLCDPFPIKRLKEVADGSIGQKQTKQCAALAANVRCIHTI